MRPSTETVPSGHMPTAGPYQTAHLGGYRIGMHAGGRACVGVHARVRTCMFMLTGSCWMIKATPIIIIHSITVLFC